MEGGGGDKYTVETIYKIYRHHALNIAVEKSKEQYGVSQNICIRHLFKKKGPQRGW